MVLDTVLETLPLAITLADGVIVSECVPVPVWETLREAVGLEVLVTLLVGLPDSVEDTETVMLTL